MIAVRLTATPEEAAAFLGIPPRVLRRWRRRGIGPASVRVSRELLYSWRELDQWVKHRQ